MQKIVFIATILLFFISLSHAEDTSGSGASSCCCLIFFILIGVVAFWYLKKYYFTRHKIDEARKKLASMQNALPEYAYSGNTLSHVVLPSVKFIEERAIRQWVSGGPRFRVTKGVWFALNKGRSESHGEMRVIDDGRLSISADTFVFSGSTKNITLQKKKMNSFEVQGTTQIAIGVENRQKLVVFDFGSTASFVAFMSAFYATDSTQKYNGEKKGFEFLSVDSVLSSLALFGENEKVKIEDLEAYASCVASAVSILQRFPEVYGEVVEVDAIAKLKEIASAYDKYRAHLLKTAEEAKKQQLGEIIVPPAPKI